MAKVETWYKRFCVRLTQRVPRHDWPPAGAEFWESYRAALEKAKVSEKVANEALQVLAESPPDWLYEYLPTLIGNIRSIQNPVAAAVAPAPVEVADAAIIAASADCPECAGTGWATRHLRIEIGSSLRAFPVQLYCRCPLGRWRLAHTPPSQYDDLQALPELWFAERRHPSWEATPLTSDVVAEAGVAAYFLPGEPLPISEAKDLATRLARKKRNYFQAQFVPEAPLGEKGS